MIKGLITGMAISFVIVMLLLSAGCGPSKTGEGSRDVSVYRPIPGVVCFSTTIRNLSCLYEVNSIDSLTDRM